MKKNKVGIIIFIGIVLSVLGFYYKYFYEREKIVIENILQNDAYFDLQSNKKITQLVNDDSNGCIDDIGFSSNSDTTFIQKPIKIDLILKRWEEKFPKSKVEIADNTTNVIAVNKLKYISDKNIFSVTYYEQKNKKDFLVKKIVLNQYSLIKKDNDLQLKSIIKTFVWKDFKWRLASEKEKSFKRE